MEVIDALNRISEKMDAQHAELAETRASLSEKMEAQRAEADATRASLSEKMDAQHAELAETRASLSEKMEAQRAEADATRASLSEKMDAQHAELAETRASLSEKMDAQHAEVLAKHASLEQLVVDFKESLETEMRSGFTSVNAKLDDVSSRLDRHAGLLRTGGIRIARLDDWAEKVDKSLESKDNEIAELRERVARLEQKSA
jgi:chromosome segregation ATPase